MYSFIQSSLCYMWAASCQSPEIIVRKILQTNPCKPFTFGRPDEIFPIALSSEGSKLVIFPTPHFQHCLVKVWVGWLLKCTHTSIRTIKEKCVLCIADVCLIYYTRQYLPDIFKNSVSSYVCSRGAGWLFRTTSHPEAQFPFWSRQRGPL